MRTRLALALAVLLAACLPYTPGAGPKSPRAELWMEAGMEKVTVYIVRGNGITERVGTVQPGEARRLWLPVVNGRTVLVAETMRGRAEYVADLTTTHSNCWSWRLPYSTTAIADFPVPCDAVRGRR